jgi:hypothetical protein
MPHGGMLRSPGVRTICSATEPLTDTLPPMVTRPSRDKSGQQELRGLPLVGAVALTILIVPFMFTIRAGGGEFYPGAYLLFVLVGILITGVVVLIRWLMRKRRNRRR